MLISIIVYQYLHNFMVVKRSKTANRIRIFCVLVRLCTVSLLASTYRKVRVNFAVTGIAVTCRPTVGK